MTNEYFNFEAGMRLPRLQTAKAAKVNAIFDAIVAAFDMLPSPSALATGTENYAEATGPANHYAATIPGFTAYIDGVTCLVRIPVTNTGPCFLDVNGLGEIPMRRANGGSIGVGDAAGGAVLQMTVISGTFRITSGLSLLGVSAVASNIAFSPSSGMTSIDVQSALLELKALIAALSFAASAISTTAGGIIQGGSNVQAQMERLSAALGGDASFSSTISSLLDGKQPYSSVLAAITALAVAADLRAGTSTSAVLTPGAVLDAMAWNALTDGSTIAIDHAAGVNRTITIAGNRTVSAPSNAKPGWPLNLRVKQDGTGSRTLTWDAAFDFGEATAPVLSTAAGAEDLVCFMCLASGKFAHIGTKRRVD